MGLSALLAAGAVALNIFGGPYKGVVAFCGCISIVAAVFIYTKYIGVEYYYDVTFDQVKKIEEEGSVTIEIPYRPYKYDDNKWEETRYLLVTVVKENGRYKISDYQLKE